VSRKSVYWWLRWAVVAFVLSAWVAVGVGGAVAHADGTSRTTGDSSSQSTADTPKEPKEPKEPKAAKPDTQEPKGTAPDETTTKDPDDPSKPRARHGSHRNGLTTPKTTATKTAKPESGDPKTAKPETDDPKLETSHTAKLAAVASTPSTSDPEPAAPKKSAAIAPAVSSAPSANTIRLPTTREVSGLISDAGVLAASVVYTVADTVAQAFGPHSFFGAPYALATAVANSAAAAGRTLIGGPASAVSTGPFEVDYGVINGLSFLFPQKPPAGANDPTITVTPAHPLPIILLNGTIATQGENWGVGAPVLANAGYKVYTFNYGNITDDPNFPVQSTDDIRSSAQQLSDEVTKVLEETGAPKVILIGHSQGGGILPAYYINNLDGADKVSQVIGIAPSNHGTDVSGLIGLQSLPVLGPLVTAFANALGPALEQQSVGNAFQQEVYGNGDTRPGVLYTNIISKNDEIVTPYTQQLLDGPGVTNVVLQDLYPNLPAGHLGIVLSPQVWSVVLDALAANPAANPLPSSALAA
jgi:triacylglycerol esterase/lipase EstA (alpha/beta hydrolase family)